MPPFKSIAATCLGLMLVSSAAASEYCTKEQYERDRALIEMATSSGWLVKGTQGLADSILVDEAEWYKMNYPQQIGFMQALECSTGGPGGKKFLYMNVKSLATGTLLASWRFGALEPTGVRPPTNPEMSGDMGNENRIGLTGNAERPSSRLQLRNAIRDLRRSTVHATPTPRRITSPSTS
jgi:hypothetical protein